MIKVGMISLGCPKNQVDAEILLKTLEDGGFTLTNREDDADVIIVNTCGFLESAAEEAGAAHSIYEALLQIHVDDRIGMLADITAALADMRVSIVQINTQKLPGDRAVVNITVGCKNLSHFNSMVSRLKTIKGVEDIQRGNI